MHVECFLSFPFNLVRDGRSSVSALGRPAASCGRALVDVQDCGQIPQRALRRPLEAAGVEFIDENGSGVKLRAKKGCAMPCKGCLKNKHRLPFENVRSGQRQADTQPMCAAFRYGRPRSPIRTTRCGGAN